VNEKHLLTIDDAATKLIAPNAQIQLATASAENLKNPTTNSKREPPNEEESMKQLGILTRIKSEFFELNK
jgi:hypothetical protein